MCLFDKNPSKSLPASTGRRVLNMYSILRASNRLGNGLRKRQHFRNESRFLRRTSVQHRDENGKLDRRKALFVLRITLTAEIAKAHPSTTFR